MEEYNKISEVGHPTVTADKNNVHVYIYFTAFDKSIRKIKGFYFKNGNHPTYAAYGSEIENVVGWLPR